MRFRKVLIAVDDDPIAAQAAEVGVDLARTLNAEVALIRIFEQLRDLGYDGSYSSVWRHARAFEEERGNAAADAYVPLIFAPGEAYQFDWSHEIVVLNG